MNTENAKEHIEKQLEQGDSLVGFFYAQQSFKLWMFFFIGPLAVLAIKYYYIAVSKKGINFYQLNMLGKFKNSGEFFTFDEIKSVVIGDGILQRPIVFSFYNGRKLKIKAQLKGGAKVAKITKVVQEHIQQNITYTESEKDIVTTKIKNGAFCIDCDLDFTQTELKKNNYRCPRCYSEL